MLGWEEGWVESRYEIIDSDAHKAIASIDDTHMHHVPTDNHAKQTHGVLVEREDAEVDVVARERAGQHVERDGDALVLLLLSGELVVSGWGRLVGPSHLRY